MKSWTRQLRGKGDTLKVESNTKLPKDWSLFLRVDSNKLAFFTFLADQVTNLTIPNEKELIVTRGENIVSQGQISNMEDLAPCNHEESDTRMILHCKNAYDSGYRNIMITATMAYYKHTASHYAF